MTSFTSRSRRRGVLALAAALAALALAAPAANAGVLVASAPNCMPQSLVQPFLPWLDLANYVVAPGGTFESGAGSWTLAGNAGVTPANEPWFVTALSDSRALGLPAGSSATSPTMCVGIGHPDMRLFVKRIGGTPLSTLRADVLFEDADGHVQSLTIGHIPGGDSWSLTPQMPIVANLLPLLPGSMTPVRFVYTPEDSAAWAIDDVYVDPWRGS